MRHEVLGAEWKDDDGVWEVRVRNLRTGEEFIDRAEIFINNGGLLKYVIVEKRHPYAGTNQLTATGDGRISRVWRILKALNAIRPNGTSQSITMASAWLLLGLGAAESR